MRLIKTYRLRIYADTDTSERICGDVHPLDEKRSYPFKNADELTVLLRKLAGEAPHAATPKRTDSPREMG
jgi:hypothetical protein